MVQKSHGQNGQPKAPRLKAQLKVRMRVLIAGILGGGTIIAFPAASAAIVVYLALALGAIGVMAWTGVVALASVALAALILPVLIVIAVLIAVIGVRSFARMTSPTCAVEDANGRQIPVGDSIRGEIDHVLIDHVLQEELDDWETDGGPAAPPRRRVARRRVRRSLLHGPRADVALV
jgi:hypothetical protein